MAAPAKRTETIPRGFTASQFGVHVAAVSASAALPVSLTGEWVYIVAPVSNTDTVWMGTTSTISSGTGIPFYSGTTLAMPMRVTTNTLYFQSSGGSSVVNYVVLGKQ